jgi:hypothetical protein
VPPHGHVPTARATGGLVSDRREARHGLERGAPAIRHAGHGSSVVRHRGGRSDHSKRHPIPSEPCRLPDHRRHVGPLPRRHERVDQPAPPVAAARPSRLGLRCPTTRVPDARQMAGLRFFSRRATRARPPGQR